MTPLEARKAAAQAMQDLAQSLADDARRMSELTEESAARVQALRLLSYPPPTPPGKPESPTVASIHAEVTAVADAVRILAGAVADLTEIVTAREE